MINDSEKWGISMEQKLYFHERMNDALDKVMEYPMTIISAPSAFGKQTVAREAARRAEEQGMVVKWTKLYQDEKMQYLDWILHELEQVQDEEILYVIERCESISNIDQDRRFKRLKELWNSKFHCVCVMNEPLEYREIILHQGVHCIEKKDLEFREKEIVRLYQLNGIKISYRTARQLFDYTGGWVGALMLAIHEYQDSKTLVPGIGINSLMEETYIHKLKEKEREALFSLTGFEELDLEQICYLIGRESEQIGDLIKIVVDHNPFISYDMPHDKYHVQKVLYYYLNRSIKKQPWSMQRRIYMRWAEWYEKRKEFFKSIVLYYSLKEFEAIYRQRYTLSDLCKEMSENYLDVLWNILEQSPYYLKCKYTRFLMLCACIFIMWKQPAKGRYILNEAEEIVQQVLKLPVIRQNYLEGEFCLIRALQYMNEPEKWIDYYEKAENLIEGVSILFDRNIIWTSGIPSVLYLYHSVSGTLQSSIELLEKCMETYYRMTDGNGTGNYIVMQAEAALLKGNFEEALTLGYQGMKLAEKREQYSVKFAGALVLMRVLRCQNNYTKMERYLDEIIRDAKRIKHRELTREVDLCAGYIYTLTGDLEKVPEWIKIDHSADNDLSERMINFANFLYLRVLLLQKEEQAAIAIGQYFRNLAQKSNFLYAEIQIVLLIGVAYHRMGNQRRGIQYLKEVLDLVRPDGLYLPIVEFYTELVKSFELLFHEENYRKDVERIMEMFQKLVEMGEALEKENKKEKNSYGLTERELEIAILGAKRYSNSEIAKRLYISENTVKYNMKSIFQKLNIKSRLELKEYFSD